MTAIIELLSSVCLLLGGVLCITGGVGLLRMPDFFSRVHAAGVTVALAHMLFNVTGILVFYPIPQFRRLPLTIARTLGIAVSKRRYLALLIVLIIFFVIPLICIGLWKLVT